MTVRARISTIGAACAGNELTVLMPKVTATAAATTVVIERVISPVNRLQIPNPRMILYSTFRVDFGLRADACQGGVAESGC